MLRRGVKLYFFYVDESGTLDPNIDPPKKGKYPREFLYVLTAIALFEGNWRGFEDTINTKKFELASRMKDLVGSPTMVDCEVKSTWIRIPKERERRPFLAHLNEMELLELSDLYYRQLEYHHMTIFSVIIDKRYLRSFMDPEKLHRKAWELLLERIQGFLGQDHPKHRGIVMADDISPQVNRKLALKHSYILREGTSSGCRLTQIVEMPLFVQSGLSNGVQLADLVGYNVYRTFKENLLDYPFFLKILPYIWTSKLTPSQKLDGLKVFPNESPLIQLSEAAGIKIARDQVASSFDL